MAEVAGIVINDIDQLSSLQSQLVVFRSYPSIIGWLSWTRIHKRK
jgi:hypothetical protein